MTNHNETGILRGRWMHGVRGARRALLAVGLAALMVATGAGMAAPASATACGQWGPATGLHDTHDRTLSVYLQKKVPCLGGSNSFKVAVHNNTGLAIGTRAVALVYCSSWGEVVPRWSMYIPGWGAWASPAVTPPVNSIVAGVIYYQRFSNTDPYVRDAVTGCIA